MTTERHDTTDEDLRSRFHELGERLERSLDVPSGAAPVPLEGTRRAPATRRLLISAAAALVLVVSAGAWLAGRSSARNDRVVASTDSSNNSLPGEDAAASSGDDWPLVVEIHEHCVEDEATRAGYAEGDYPPEATRAQDCETEHHDLPRGVFTPDDLPRGFASSAALRDLTASLEYNAALEAHGIDVNSMEMAVAAGELWRAFSNRHAVPVFDRDGEQIGWFGGGYEPDEGGFVSMEDMPQARAEADQVIADFERTGALPVTAPTDMPADDLGNSALEMLIVNEGVEVGWVDYELHRDELLQRLTDIVEIRAANPEVSDADFDDQAVGDALLILSKIPVLERQGGDFIGYLGPEQVLISESDYPAERATAEAVIIEAGGTPP